MLFCEAGCGGDQGYCPKCFNEKIVPLFGDKPPTVTDADY